MSEPVCTSYWDSLYKLGLCQTSYTSLNVLFVTSLNSEATWLSQLKSKSPPGDCFSLSKYFRRNFGASDF